MYVYISAELPELSAEENVSRTNQLFGELFRGGLNPFEVNGAYRNQREVAFRVRIPGHAIEESTDSWQFRELMALGRAYRQHSILVREVRPFGARTVSLARLYECETADLLAAGVVRPILERERDTVDAWTLEDGYVFTVEWDREV